MQSTFQRPSRNSTTGILVAVSPNPSAAHKPKVRAIILKISPQERPQRAAGTISLPHHRFRSSPVRVKTDCTGWMTASSLLQKRKMNLKENLAAARACDIPAWSTRCKFSDGYAASSAVRSVGKLRQDKAKTNIDNDSASCITTVPESKSSVDVTGRCDDGSDENIASPILAERAVLKGIGKFEMIDTVNLEVALTKTDEQVKKYAFSRACPLNLCIREWNIQNKIFPTVPKPWPTALSPRRDD